MTGSTRYLRIEFKPLPGQDRCQGLFLASAHAQILSSEEALEVLISDIEGLKSCTEHDHTEDILRFEKMKKELLASLAERWN